MSGKANSASPRLQKTLLFFKRLKNNTKDCLPLTQRPTLFIKNLYVLEKGAMEMPKIITSPWNLDDVANVLETIRSDYILPEGQTGESLTRDQITTIIETFREWGQLLPAESQEAIQETLQHAQRLLSSLNFDPQQVQSSEEILDFVETAIFALLFNLEHDLTTAEQLYPLFEVLAQTYIFLKFRQTTLNPRDLSPRLLNEKERQEFLNIVGENLTKAQIDSETINSLTEGLEILLQLVPIEPLLAGLLASEFSGNVFILFEDVNWVPRPGETGTQGADRPRYLTREEIEDILQAIPRIYSGAAENAESAHRSLIAKLRAELENIQLCPSSIGNYKQDIITQFNKSRISPGTNVGIIAANAIGEQTTQMTLNSVIGETQILIKSASGAELVEIGAWVDGWMESHPDRIQLYPKNRTEYLPLSSPVEIQTVDKNGKVFWSPITAVTRHLPGNNLVHITTGSGREVTATESKSLIVWDDKIQSLIQINGSDIKIGDWVPVMKDAGSIDMETTHLDLSDCQSSFTIPERIPLNFNFGLLVGLYLAGERVSGGCLRFKRLHHGIAQRVQTFCNQYKFTYHIMPETTTLEIYSPLVIELLQWWLGVEPAQRNIPPQAYTSPLEFVKGLLDGYRAGGRVATDADGHTMVSSTSPQLWQGLSALWSRLGIFGQLRAQESVDSLSTYPLYTFSDVLYTSGAELARRISQRSGTSYRVHNNVVLDQITSIEYLPCDESFRPNVYDLTVPSTTNFCLANGLGVADTFHSAGGDANVSQGITALTELVYARLSRRYPSCTVVFKKRLTMSQIFGSKSALVQTTIQDLLVDYSIENVPEEKEYWYAFFPAVPRDPYQYVLRLRLNPVRMLERRITIQDVAKTLIGESTASSIYVAHSSTSEGIIDIYTNPKRISAALEKIQKQLQQQQDGVASFRTEYSSRVFLSNVILPNLKNMRVKGVPGITEIFPVKEPVWSLILKERKPTPKETKDWQLETDKHFYVLEFDRAKLRISPIRPEYLYEFLESLDMRIVQETPTYALIQTPPDLEDDPFPSRIRDGVLARVKEVFRQTGQREPPLDLENYFYVTTRGSNITRLLQKKEIDFYYIHCNDIYAMIRVLGIEAARQFFIRELHDTIRSAGGYVNARHITLTADALFKQGMFLGTNYTGMYNGSAGYFSLSTHQRCTQTLSRAATFSEREALTGTSSAIAVGANVRSGTGFMDVIPIGPQLTTNPVQVQPELERPPTTGVEETSNPMIVTSSGCPNDFDVLMSLKGPKPSQVPPRDEDRIPRPNLGPSRSVAQDLASPLQTTPEAPTPLVVSDNLREAVNKIYFDPRVAETEIIEQVTTIEEKPIQVQQAPVTSFVPPPLVIPAAIPSEITKQEIAPLAPLGRRIRYTNAPVMKLPSF
jgi:hypothetical protein